MEIQTETVTLRPPTDALDELQEMTGVLSLKKMDACVAGIVEVIKRLDVMSDSLEDILNDIAYRLECLEDDARVKK